MRISQKIVCTHALWSVGPLPFVCYPTLLPHAHPFPHPSSTPLHRHHPLLSAHTWPSQIRALENQQAERKAGCVVEQREGK